MASMDIIAKDAFRSYFQKHSSFAFEILNSGIATKDAVDGNMACIHKHNIEYKSNDLERILSGNNSAMVLGDHLSDDLDDNMKNILANTLKGIFDSKSMAEASLEVTLSGKDKINIQDLIGDILNKLSGSMMMNFKTMAKLNMLGQIKFKNVTNINKSIPYYNGQRVIFNDKLKPIDGKYPIYFFGCGAIIYNENMNDVNVDTSHKILTGEDWIIYHRKFTMYPRGFRWVGNTMGITPTNTELATGSNWELIADRNDIAIARIIVTL